jgi:putative peptidoglycan lipid II flippase
LLYGTFYLFLVVDKSFASLLPQKSISALTYGYMVASIPISVIRLDQITTTSLSEEHGSLQKLNFYLKKIILISLPILAFYLLFSGFLIKTLFYYGHFTSSDVELTKITTMFYALGVPFMLIWPLIYRVFQIIDRLRPVFFVGLSGVAINILLNYVFILKLKVGISGIALSTDCALFVMCILGYRILSKINLKYTDPKINL